MRNGWMEWTFGELEQFKSALKSGRELGHAWLLTWEGTIACSE